MVLLQVGYKQWLFKLLNIHLIESKPNILVIENAMSLFVPFISISVKNRE
jgi:hypothetical protein